MLLNAPTEPSVSNRYPHQHVSYHLPNPDLYSVAVAKFAVCRWLQGENEKEKQKRPGAAAEVLLSFRVILKGSLRRFERKQVGR